MTLDIGKALENGFNRTFENSGLLLIGLFFAVGAVTSVMSETMIAAYGGVLPGEAVSAPLALSIPGPVAVALLTVAWIANAFLVVTALRTLVSDETERIPKEFYSRNIWWVALNILIGGVAYGLIVLLGLGLLIIPGIFLGVALFLWNAVVAVEDETFVYGLRRSWEMTSGHRWNLFIVILVVVSISLLLSVFAAAPSLLEMDVAAGVTSTAAGAVAAVFNLSVLSDVYRQLS